MVLSPACRGCLFFLNSLFQRVLDRKVLRNENMRVYDQDKDTPASPMPRLPLIYDERLCLGVSYCCSRLPSLTLTAEFINAPRLVLLLQAALEACFEFQKSTSTRTAPGVWENSEDFLENLEAALTLHGRAPRGPLNL